jgi:hypothetical protein
METQGKAKVALTFALYQGDALVRRDTVVQEIVKVGKDPKSHLRIDDDLASRMHAVVEVGSPSDITLIDLGNEPGTMVNGQRVNKCKIHVGDQIQIGSTNIILEKAEVAVEPSAAVVPLAVEAPVAAVPRPPVPPPPMGAPPPLPAAAARPLPPPRPPPNPFAKPFGTAPFAANPFASASNPFAAQAREQATSKRPAPVAANAAPGTYTYSIVKSGPEVNADEVEIAHAASVEVVVLWETNVLHVSHLTPPRPYYIGEETSRATPVDYFVPSQLLGSARVPVVTSEGGNVSLVILPKATGTAEIAGEGKVALAELIANGRARPFAAVPGAYELPLPPGSKARMQLEGSGLAFHVNAVNAGKPVPVGFWATMEPAAFVYTAMSFGVHMALVAVFAFFMPSMRLDNAEDIDRDQMLMMQKLLTAAAEREVEQREIERVTQATGDSHAGGTGTRAQNEEGKMGSSVTTATGGRYGVKGPKDNPDPHLARQAAIQEAAQFGMIGVLSTLGGGDPNAPTASWGQAESSGQDDKSARGNMFGADVRDSFGMGGLGLTGTGEGGGGRGEGIGLGNFGGLGHGAGGGTGQGIGTGRGRPGPGHKVSAPKIREAGVSVNGRIPPDVIQRIVRQNFGRFRLCYEAGLRGNPSLAGRVAVRFVIDRSGAVSMTSDGGSDLPDGGVVGCVVRSFAGLSFPAPEGGIVTVTYPIMFQPGDVQ